MKHIHVNLVATTNEELYALRQSAGIRWKVERLLAHIFSSLGYMLYIIIMFTHARIERLDGYRKSMAKRSTSLLKIMRKRYDGGDEIKK